MTVCFVAEFSCRVSRCPNGMTVVLVLLSFYPAAITEAPFMLRVAGYITTKVE